MTITIRALSEEPAGTFDTLVSFEDGGEHAVHVTDPAVANPEGEELLSWYFERHLRYPFLDHDREQAAVDHLRHYGQQLFAQVFGEETRCHYEYRRRRDIGFDRCRIEIVGPPSFQRLHWEALADPQLGDPLGVRVPIARRLGLLEAGFDLPDHSPTLNILVVTARPRGARDVGHRTISRPLLDAVRRAHLPVTVDLVRPGAWASLQRHLRRASSRHGTGWYQVVHFDVHGAVEPLSSPNRAGVKGHYLFTEVLPPVEDDVAVLFFETADDGVAHAVPATEVAGLLAEHRVPVAVLNACQSASPAGAEVGLAGRLVEAGVAATVGMAYPVTVSAAEAMMPVLYEHLVDGADIVDAAHQARRRLFDDRTRRAYFDHQLDLDDWVLPVVFSQRSVHRRLRPQSPTEEAAFLERQAAVAAAPEPTYGFVGRDLDIQAIERRLLVDDAANELLVRGMAGAGKSTLLTHLAWWWQRTGLVERTFTFSYEDRAWTAGQIVQAISNVLLDDTERDRLTSLPERARTEQVAGALRADRQLLVIDNAESITGGPPSIPHALGEAERERLHHLLASLRGGRTLVLIGSRTDESWLSAGCFGANVHELGGLDPQAVSVMVERALDLHGGRHHLYDAAERQALEDMVAALDGFPLALTVLLPRLARTPPSEVLADLRHGNPGAEPSDRINSALEYSHSRLSPDLQDAMTLLAPFRSVVPTETLDYYQYLVVSELGTDDAGQLDVRAALDECIASGLAAPDPHLHGHLRLQPVLPYFLRMRLADRPALANAVANAHFSLYSELADRIYKQLIDPSAEEQEIGRARAHAEHANLNAALDHGIAAGMQIVSLAWVLDESLSRNAPPAVRRDFLEHLVDAVGPPTTFSQQRQLAVLHHLAGSASWNLRDHDKALDHFQAEITVRTQLDDRRGAGAAHHQLGLVAQERRDFDEAEAHYRAALDAYIDLDERHESAGVWHQLGAVALGRGALDDAEEHCRTSLALHEEFGIQRGAAADHHNLGLVAQRRGDDDTAEHHYRAALDLWLEIDDRVGLAEVYFQLGDLIGKDRPEEADRYTRLSLDLRLAAGDRRVAANYLQLGWLATNRGAFDEADDLLSRAHERYRENGDRHGMARAGYNLARKAAMQVMTDEAGYADLAGMLRRLDHAASLYREARDLFVETGDDQNAAEATSMLETVTSARDELPTLPRPGRSSG